MPVTHTPGPWRWEVNEKSRRVQLCGGVPRFDLVVMDFTRWGFNGAAPRLREPEHDGMNIMHRVDHWAKPSKGREHHASWFKVLEHPDATLMQAAPDLLAACESVLDWLHSFGIPSTTTAAEKAAAMLTLEAVIAKAKGGAS